MQQVNSTINQMMSQIIYRPAEKRDAPDIATYIEMAGDGLTQFLDRDLVPDVTPVQMLIQQVEDENSVFCYDNTHVAARDGKIIGIAHSFPAANNPTTEQLKHYLPQERLDLLQ